MLLEDLGARIVVAALVAHEWLLVRVRPHVHLQVRSGFEAVATQPAEVLLAVAVHAAQRVRVPLRHALELLEAAKETWKASQHRQKHESQ